MNLLSRASFRWFGLVQVTVFAVSSLAQNAHYTVTPIIFNSDTKIFVYAAKINNRGYVTAWARLRGAQTQGFNWKDGQIVANLPALGGTCSFAWGLNDTGDVVGSSCLLGDAVRHAVLWRHQTLTDLGVTGPDTGSSASQINEHDDIAGGFSRTDGTVGAFFWRHGASLELGSLGGLTSSLVASARRGRLPDKLTYPAWWILDSDWFRIMRFYGRKDLTDLGQIFDQTLILRTE